MKIITPYATILDFDPDKDLVEITEFDEGFIVAIDDEFISPKFLFKPMEGEQWSKCVIMCEDKFDASEKVQDWLEKFYAGFNEKYCAISSRSNGEINGIFNHNGGE